MELMPRSIEAERRVLFGPIDGNIDATAERFTSKICRMTTFWHMQLLQTTEDLGVLLNRPVGDQVWMLFDVRQYCSPDAIESDELFDGKSFVSYTIIHPSKFFKIR